jgi:hypothetical protein
MGAIVWSPAVRNALNVQVVNNFAAGTLTARISGILDVVGAKTTDSENIAALVLGKNFSLYKRPRNANPVHKRGVNIHEQRAKLGNYAEFLSMNRFDAIYDKIDRILATAQEGGRIAAEGPSRMVEAAIPIALETVGYDAVPYFSELHPVSGNPGDTSVFSNLKDYGDLDFEAYDQAVQDLAELPDEDGYASGGTVTHLLYSPKYATAAREILTSLHPLNYAGENFRAQDGVKGIKIPAWAGDDMWAVVDASMDADRPFWFVEGRQLRLKPLYTDPEGTWETLTNELLWGIEGDMAVLLGNHRKAILSAPAANLATILAKHKARFEMNETTFDLEAA